MQKPMRCAAIDVGSNTIRLLIAEAQAEGSFHVVLRKQVITRLGEGLHRSGRLQREAMERSAVVLNIFAELARQSDTMHIKAVATAAVREAENGCDFVQMVAQQSGLHLEIIDGKAEASLATSGAETVLPKSVCSDMILFDIGGGSTEFIRVIGGVNGGAIESSSHKLGVVRLVEAYLHHDPPTASDYTAMVREADSVLQQVERDWHGRIKPSMHLVGTAGTVTTMAALHLQLERYDAEKVDNHHIPVEALWKMRDHLCSLSQAERAAIPAIEAGRSDLIVAGFAIVEAIMRRWHCKQLISVDAGLLEGCLQDCLQHCSQGDDHG